MFVLWLFDLSRIRVHLFLFHVQVHFWSWPAAPFLTDWWNSRCTIIKGWTFMLNVSQLTIYYIMGDGWEYIHILYINVWKAGGIGKKTRKRFQHQSNISFWLIFQGKEFALIVGSDNVAAVIDPRILSCDLIFFNHNAMLFSLNYDFLDWMI